MPLAPVDRALVWLRRDLRCDDHPALHHALRSARQVWCLFVLDEDILAPLRARGVRSDRRVEFILASLAQVHEQLRTLAERNGVRGAGLLVRHGSARTCVIEVAEQLGVQRVLAHHDDDPFALERDAAVSAALMANGRPLHTFKDHVVMERSEVLTQAGRPFSVFTPYKNAWLKQITPQDVREWPVAPQAGQLAPLPPREPDAPTLAQLGFEPSNLGQLRLPLGPKGAQALWGDFQQRMTDYHLQRDFPGIKGVSYLSPHLRFGTLSIRQLAREALARRQAGERGAEVWLSELIWRDFYHQVLHHHPQVVQRSFKPEYDRITWRSGPQADALFAAWQAGRTGYPLVDAAMRQLAQTGFMHNRLRMVAASFLCKHLGLDWRRGEAHFAEHLLDFDLAANNGGWQWASSSGCDAQPYFRIFNPVTQSERFDADGRFIRRYVPELAGLPNARIHAPWLASPVELAAAGVALGTTYPQPVVDHATARAQTLARYAVVKSTAGPASGV